MEENLDNLIIRDWERSIGFSSEDPLTVSMEGVEVPTDTSVGAYAEGVGRTWGEMMRGALAGTLGAGGDIESIFYGIKNIIDKEAGEGAADAFLAGMAEPTKLYTTEEVSEAMPQIPGNEDQEAAAAIGEMLGPGGVIKAGMTAVKKSPKAVTKTGAATATAVAPTAEGASGRDQIIDELYNEFATSEGNGDTTGAAPTGKRGLTTSLYETMKQKHGANISEEEASKLYIGEAYDGFTSQLNGFDQLDSVAQARIIDTAYNLGWENMLNYPKFSKAVAAGDAEGAMKELLDTAQTDKMSSRGIAKRRAQNYNLVNPSSKITSVRQMKDGTIRYMKGKTMFFSFKPPKGKHKTSAVGVLKVN